MPKPLIPVHGRPILEHIIDLFKKYDVNEILLSVGYLKDKIKNHFSVEKSGVKINYVEEDEPLGTAGPIKFARGMLKETFFVSNGDELKSVNLDEMMKLHRKNKALATIALVKVDNPSLYGVANLFGDKIIEFIEKPSKEEAPSNFINAGLYIIEPEAIDIIPDGRASFEMDVFPKIAKMGRLYGFRFDGQWFDTGSMERYENAIKNWRGV
jgi:NDP-sugar pyrophosphorylase family protein